MYILYFRVNIHAVSPVIFVHFYLKINLLICQSIYGSQAIIKYIYHLKNNELRLNIKMFKSLFVCALLGLCHYY